MATNKLLPFANGETPNVIPFEDWNSLPARLTGFQSGIASSQQFNYILAQGGTAGYVIGQFVVDHASTDADLNATALYAAFKKAIAAFVPGGVADNSINGGKLTNGSVSQSKLSSNSVGTAQIINANVTEEKLANNSVSSRTIAAGAVVDGKLGANSVNASNIKDGNVTETKLGNGSVTNAKIGAGAVTFDKVSSAAIATDEEAKAGVATNKLMTPKATALAVAAQLPPSVPSGVIVPFAGTNVPEGWLICNGAAVSRTTYAKLFAAIGTKYGSGDGSSTFNLPQIDGRYIQYTTRTSKVGNKLEAGLPNITGTNSPYGIETGHMWSVYGGSFYRDDNNQTKQSRNHLESASNGTVKFSAAKSSSIFGASSTVQPLSIQQLAIIKI